VSAVTDVAGERDALREVGAIRDAGGTRIGGPGALAGGWRRALSLTWTLGYLDWRLAFFGSVLGYLWRLIKPATYFGIYYVLFTHFIPLSGDVKYGAAVLLTGIMINLFFMEATTLAVPSILTRENLVRKIHFPRVVIPMAVITTALLNFAFNLIAVVIFVAASRVPLRWSDWQVIPAFGLLVIWVAGLSMLMSALFVRYRDVAPIWEVLGMALFYATPILYPIERIKYEWARELIMHNPMAVTIQQIRHAVFDPSVPSAAQAIGGWSHLLLVFAGVIAMFFLGLWTFHHAAPEVAENL
jgi:ABC-2 type transport system permease protein